MLIEKGAKLSIRLLGSFRVIDRDGTDRTPRGQKACALVAILALSPDYSRSRAVLQDKLWSRFAAPQASANLRQALSEIRHAFGPFADLLIANRRTVALSRIDISIDIDGTGSVPQATGLELLEDVHVNDPEFEDWVRLERQRFQQNSHDPTGSYKIADSGLLEPSRRIKLAHKCSGGKEAQQDALLNSTVANLVMKDVRDRIAVEILTEEEVEYSDLYFQIESRMEPQGGVLSVILHAGNAVLWSNAYFLDSRSGGIFQSPDIRRAVNDLSDAILDACIKIGKAGSGRKGFVDGLSAVQQMFRLGNVNIDGIDTQIGRAYEETEHPVFLAWKAYCRTFVAETGDQSALDNATEDAVELLGNAFGSDPGNATIFAVASHVNGFLLKEYQVAHDFAERSLQLTPTNPLALIFLARSKSYLGDHQAGYELALMARSLVGFGPYRTFVDSVSGATALLSGRYDEAVRLTELVRRAAPGYKPPLHMLAPLYLKSGNQKKAQRVLEEIRRTEPDFDLIKLKEAAGPGSAVVESGLLELPECRF